MKRILSSRTAKAQVSLRYTQSCQSLCCLYTQYIELEKASDKEPWTRPHRKTVQVHLENEPPHDKTNKVACGPSEDSDQPGHLPGLFAVRSMGS